MQTSFNKKQRRLIKKSPVQLAFKVIETINDQIKKGNLDIDFENRIVRISPDVFLSMNTSEKQLLAFIKNINYYVNSFTNITNGYNRGVDHPYIEGVHTAGSSNSNIQIVYEDKLQFFVAEENQTQPSIVGIYQNNTIKLQVPTQ